MLEVMDGQRELNNGAGRVRLRHLHISFCGVSRLGMIVDLCSLCPMLLGSV